MEFKLTSNWQYSHHDKDGCDRNYISFYLNNVLILKQKIPFDINWESGFDRRTSIYDVYLLNGKLYQKRRKYLGCSHPDNDKMRIREVSFPLSKNRLAQFNIPKDFKVELKNFEISC
jgi:hypothetical protein